MTFFQPQKLWKACLATLLSAALLGGPAAAQGFNPDPIPPGVGGGGVGGGGGGGAAPPATPPQPAVAPPLQNDGGPAPGGDGSDAGDRPSIPTAFFNGRPEYIAIGPEGEAAAAAAALGAQGAQRLRRRDLPGLGLVQQVFDLRGRLGLRLARATLDGAAPNTILDRNALYRSSQGPRLYAAALIGDARPGACRIGALRVGLIDGPVNPDHPALRRARLTQLSTLLPGDRAPDARHGTAVAALIAGEDPAGSLTGYARGVRLYAVSAFARERGGPAADVDRIGGALDVLARNAVRLVNMSFAGPENRALARLLRAANGQGMAMIAAAGNDGARRVAFPAASRHVIAVTAVDAAARRYARANTGSALEFAAPGVDLYVATATGAAYASGTSYAAPIATALAARRMARGTAAGALRGALRGQADDLGPPGRDRSFGYGLLRASGC